MQEPATYRTWGGLKAENPKDANPSDRGVRVKAFGGLKEEPSTRWVCQVKHPPISSRNTSNSLGFRRSLGSCRIGEGPYSAGAVRAAPLVVPRAFGSRGGRRFKSGRPDHFVEGRTTLVPEVGAGVERLPIDARVYLLIVALASDQA